MKSLKLPIPDKKGSSSSVDPLDNRYYDSEIAKYLSEQSRIAYQAYLETALAHTLADFGVCSRKVAQEIEKAASEVGVAEIYEEEKKTKHDIKALVNCIKTRVSGEAKPYVHFGATSYDIVASASALQMRQAIEKLVVPRLNNLLATLLDLVEKYASATQIGRTHGQHAVPITFGFAIAEYVDRIGSNRDTLLALSQKLPGKFSGAVGAYNALSLFVDDPFSFEKTVLGYVGLKPATYSTQIAPPESTVRLIDELTISAGIMANLGHDMRHLQRSEIAEIRERFENDQTGSSTMAHKRNPWNFENIVSMSKQVIAQSVNANLNLSSEHQRDLTDSASSRFYATVLASVASMAERLSGVMKKIEIDEEKMHYNLQLSGGAIAAEPFYLLLSKYGYVLAHDKSKELAHKAQEQKRPLHKLIQEDQEAAKYWQRFSEVEKSIIQEPEKYYTGLAAKKAQMVARKWRRKL